VSQYKSKVTRREATKSLLVVLFKLKLTGVLDLELAAGEYLLVFLRLGEDVEFLELFIHGLEHCFLGKWILLVEVKLLI
jgi:hypothetical protein